MIKTFCDVCKKEIESVDNFSGDRFAEMASLANAQVEITMNVLVSTDKRSGNGHICQSCLWDVLEKFNPRKTAMLCACGETVKRDNPPLSQLLTYTCHRCGVMSRVADLRKANYGNFL